MRKSTKLAALLLAVLALVGGIAPAASARDTGWNGTRVTVHD